MPLLRLFMPPDSYDVLILTPFYAERKIFVRTIQLEMIMLKEGFITASF